MRNRIVTDESGAYVYGDGFHGATLADALLRHYVEFFYPPGIEGEYRGSVEIINRRDNPKLVRFPSDCDGFYFFDRLEIKFGDEILTGEKRNESCRYIIGEPLEWDDVPNPKVPYIWGIQSVRYFKTQTGRILAENFCSQAVPPKKRKIVRE